MRNPRFTLAVASTLAALALPASASASASGRSHVVVLNVTAEPTCERTILDVTMAHGVLPETVYTDAPCGFAAHLPTRKARDLAADPRVQSVVANGDPSGG